jgi:hypothetical protein
LWRAVVRKFGRKRPLGRPRHGREDKIKADLKGIK